MLALSSTATAIIGGVVWLVVTFGAAAIGGRFPPDDWYARLKKPSWNPPGWVFAPVWTALYLMMAAAAWLVWHKEGVATAIVPLSVFVLQLVLNALWSWLFFGRHEPGAALIDLVTLWIAIAVTILLFWRRDALAGALLLPYLVWVTFAGVLNATVWRLNR